MRIGAFQCMRISTCAALVTTMRRLRGTAWLAHRNGAGDRLFTEVRTLHIDVCIVAAIVTSQLGVRGISKRCVNYCRLDRRSVGDEQRIAVWHAAPKPAHKLVPKSLACRESWRSKLQRAAGSPISPIGGLLPFEIGSSLHCPHLAQPQNRLCIA